MGEFGIVGDPTGMEMLADALVSRARRLGEMRVDVQEVWSKAIFTGPYATTVTERLRREFTRLDQAADLLATAASRLRGDAKTVEQAIATARRAFEEAERERLRLAREQEGNGGHWT